MAWKASTNKKDPVEFGMRRDGSIWMSIETRNSHSQSDWPFGMECAQRFKEAVEGYVDENGEIHYGTLIGFPNQSFILKAKDSTGKTHSGEWNFGQPYASIFIESLKTKQEEV